MDINASFYAFVIIGIILALALLAGIVCGVITVVKRIRRAKSGDGDISSVKWLVALVLCVIIAFLSWIYNLGWLRVFLTWIPIPLLYTVAFLVINIIASAKASSSHRLRIYMSISFATYLLTYLLFPDFGDIGGAYFFFSLIRNDAVAGVMFYIVPITLISNIIVLILESIETARCRS